MDYTPVTIGLTLNGTHRTKCFEVQTFDNDGPNHPREFGVRLGVTGQSTVRQELDSVTVTITDDDGKESVECSLINIDTFHWLLLFLYKPKCLMSVECVFFHELLSRKLASNEGAKVPS